MPATSAGQPQALPTAASVTAPPGDAQHAVAPAAARAMPPQSRGLMAGGEPPAGQPLDWQRLESIGQRLSMPGGQRLDSLPNGQRLESLAGSLSQFPSRHHLCGGCRPLRHSTKLSHCLANWAAEAS